MPQTYFDSDLTGEQINKALNAIDGVVTPSNNGKVLYIDDGKIKAASASRWSGGYPEPTGIIDISANGLVNVKDYAEANVQVPGGGEIEVIPLSVTANDTYTAPAGKAYSPVTVSVSGGGVANPMFLLNPTEMDAVAATATQAPSTIDSSTQTESIISYAPFVSKINRLDSYTGGRWVSYKGTYGGVKNVAFMGRGGRDRSGMILTTKIPGGIYSALHIRYEITQGIYSDAWFKLFLQNALGFMNNDVYPNGENTLYEQQLATALKADNEQVIDITNIVDDFYVGFGDYSGFVKIRGLWFEI